MGHDQRFKELLQTFLQEFLALFFPEVERRLDFRSVEFLDKEVFTDVTEGSSRQADLVAKLATHEGEPELVLIHIEVQAKPERDFEARMFEYYALLWLRHRMPVLPIVVYLRGGSDGLTAEEYRTDLFGREVLRFRYECLELAALDVEEYRRGVGPVGAALGALMQRAGSLDPAELKVSLLLEVIESGLDEARQLLLANIVETYLELSGDDRTRYLALVSRKEYRKVQEVDETWMDKLLREGREAGLEEGREEGREVGREEGLQLGAIAGKRQTLLTLLRRKFGSLPKTVAARVESIQSSTELDGLLERILTATSLEDMELDA